MIVLVVDDAADIRTSTQMLLELSGHVVEVATNGAEAVAAASERPPDVILMDLHMPVMDGFTAARRLRELPQTRSIPIVAVSAYVREKAWCERALAAGMNECLCKPFDHAVLTVMLEGLSRES